MVPSLAQPDRGISRAVPIAWAETQVAEIERRGTTINYTNLCYDKQVVFFGQNLRNTPPVRDHLRHNAAALKKAGITHFAIEFNKMASSPDYKCLCDELSAHGIKIILADVDQRRTPDEEQQEAYMTKRIVDILEAEPNTKVAALFSSFHTGRDIMDGIRPAAVQIESAGYSVIRVK